MAEQIFMKFGMEAVPNLYFQISTIIDTNVMGAQNWK
jgi:hypothetical protein